MKYTEKIFLIKKDHRYKTSLRKSYKKILKISVNIFYKYQEFHIISKKQFTTVKLRLSARVLICYFEF